MILQRLNNNDTYADLVRNHQYWVQHHDSEHMVSLHGGAMLLFGDGRERLQAGEFETVGETQPPCGYRLEGIGFSFLGTWMLRGEDELYNLYVEAVPVGPIRAPATRIPDNAQIVVTWGKANQVTNLMRHVSDSDPKHVLFRAAKYRWVMRFGSPNDRTGYHDNRSRGYYPV